LPPFLKGVVPGTKISVYMKLQGVFIEEEDMFATSPILPSASSLTCHTCYSSSDETYSVIDS
jgi:hypothetical protein